MSEDEKQLLLNKLKRICEMLNVERKKQSLAHSQAERIANELGYKITEDFELQKLPS